MNLSLSVASSSKSKSWKNQSISWLEFKNRLKEPTVTQETVAEYTKMTTAQKGEVKDVGGFVAGHLKNGQRKKGNVVKRSMITLDADYPRKELWEDFLMMYDCAALIYSTHSHRPEKPRYRLIIPLSREVLPDEYVPIALKIADNLGLNNFDDTTYQPERLMYWGSHSRDAEYVFLENEAEFLNPDDVLNEYPDWTDISYWPELPKAKKLLARDVKKAGEPAEKPGLIGAFCRQYTISEAISKFLPEVYLQTDHVDRFTYAEGSTSGGLVVYDDKFAYSHHSTDPAGEQLVNAWDMVRIHKFIEQDDDAKTGTPVSRLPSMKVMEEFAGSIKSVVRELENQRYRDAGLEFEGESDFSETTEIEDDEKWASYTRSGKKIVNYFLLAKQILKEIPLWYFKSDTEEQFYFYDAKKGIWRGGAESYLKSYITKNKLKLDQSTKNQNETISAIKALATKPSLIPSAPPNKIVLENGIFDLHNLKFESGFNKDLYAISSHPIAYNPAADCPTFDGYLEKVVGKSNKLLIYEWMGFLFYGAYKLQNVLFLFGGGGTGKSTLINLMQDLVGRQSTSTISLESLVTDGFAVAGLVGKTANFDSDAKPEYLADGGLFKKLSGEDDIYANPKGKPGYSFRNKAKLTFSMNRLPRMNDHSGGMARRTIIVTMDTKITKEMKEMFPYKQMVNELSGVFNKAVSAFNKALKIGKFSVSQEVIDNLSEWLSDNDPIGEFVKERVIQGDGYKIRATALYRAYKDYANELGHKNPATATVFYNRLKQLGFTKKVVRLDNGTVQGFEGIRAIEEF